MSLYLDHFGFKESPFKITPITDFFFHGGQRGDVLHTLKYSISSGEGIVMIIGEVGSGKTMLLRTLLEQLPPEINSVYIPNPSLNDREILYNICEELGMNIDRDKPDMVRSLQDYLIGQRQQGKQTVVFIDEAQAMPTDSLEELRLLSNLETSRDKLLQMILFGQPEFEDNINQHAMRQFRERITVRLQLRPLTHDDVVDYLISRINSAGYQGKKLFEKKSSDMIFSLSKGITRRINILADKALLSAFARGAHRVEVFDVKRAARDSAFLVRKKTFGQKDIKLFSRVLAGAILSVAFLLIVLIINRAMAPNVQTAKNQPNEKTVIAQVPKDLEENKSVSTPVVEDVQESISPNSEASLLSVQISEDVILQQQLQAERSAEIELTAEEALLIAVQALEGGIVKDLAEEDLALALAQVAQEHGEAVLDEELVDEQGNVWVDDSDPEVQVIDNEKWNWMPQNSYLRLRLNATERFLREVGNNQQEGYTARLITLSRNRAILLERFLRQLSEFYPVRNVMIYPLQLQSGEQFVVTYGIYSTQEQARVYLQFLPYQFGSGKPYVQSLDKSYTEADKWW